jgi:P27 family predicted phage terminase small subunit
MTGRKAKPVELKILRMTAKKADKLVRRMTPVAGPLIDAPDFLSAEQKLDWQYAIENAPRDLLKRIDKAVLAGFIIAQDTHRQASVAMQRTQLLVKSPTQGIPQQNPYLPIVNRQYMLMLRGASELGFTPCSRARIDSSNVPAPRESDWEDVETG